MAPGIRGTCLVTGAAGFIGSHLAERLLDEGYRVVGLDSFTTYYPRSLKEANLAGLLSRPGFSFLEEDLNQADLPALFSGVNYVFHQAAQAGVRPSWGSDFEVYVRQNILATQRLLETAKRVPLTKFIYASSSSIYGNTPHLPMREDSIPCPISPYGVTKLAAEHLCRLYHLNFGVPAVSLRYFTVYGPRQRPDMALRKFITWVLEGRPITIFGDGNQTRDFTFISDAVEANLRALGAPDGSVFNVGGGSRVTINDAIRLIEEFTGERAQLRYEPHQHGDVDHTLADTGLSQEKLGFAPKMPFEDGLRAEVAWLVESRLPV